MSALPAIGDVVELAPDACHWLTAPVPFRVIEARPGLAGWAYLTGWVTDLDHPLAVVQQTVHVELARLRTLPERTLPDQP